MLGFIDVRVSETRSDVCSAINQSSSRSNRRRKEDALQYYTFIQWILPLPPNLKWKQNKTNYYSFIPFIHRMAEKSTVVRFIMQLQFREKEKKTIQSLSSI